MDEKTLTTALARRLATRKLDEKLLASIAARLVKAEIPIHRIDPCVYGICIDFDWRHAIEQIDLRKLIAVWPENIRDIDIFPYGVVQIDGATIRISAGV